MPLTLITGLPGHGKTLYTLARFKDEAEKAGRPVFHNDIKGLNIPNWQVWDPEKWEELPAGALMIIDECQKPFPVRGRGQPPSWIENLSTHRHLGLDFVLITQNPMLMDSFVRRLVDRHFHVVRKFGTHFATIHEFVNGCKENVDKSREGSIRHEWRYDKKVFEWYKSAEVHTVKRRLPARVYLLGLIPFILGGIIWFGYNRLNPDAAAQRINEHGSTSGQQHAPGQPGQVRSVGPMTEGPMTPEAYIASYTPRIPDLPHTAPAYDEVTKPKLVPYPAACVASKSRCKCYTQQATVMPTSDDLCRQIVDRGFFIAWDNAPNVPVAAGSGAQPLQVAAHEKPWPAQAPL